MPLLPMQNLLCDAVRLGYAVAAFNVFNDFCLDAVLAAASRMCVVESLGEADDPRAVRVVELVEWGDEHE